MSELKQRLMDFGLSDKEGLVYLAMLELGPASAQDIAKKSAVNRATTYVMLEALKRRGLLSSVDHGKKTFFAAESPVHLRAIVEGELQHVNDKKIRLIESMPQFMALFNAIDNKPKVRYFEGDEGLYACREAMYELARGGHAWQQFIHVDRETNAVSQRHMDHKMKTATGKFSLRVLYSLEPGVILPAFPPSISLRELPRGFFSFNGELDIFENFIVLFMHKMKSVGVLIESQDVARLFRSLFELAWKQAETKEKDA